MVTTVLDYLKQGLENHILLALSGEGAPLMRFQKMCESIDKFYESGHQPCLFAILLMGSARDVFHDTLQASLQIWIEAIAEVLITAGLDETLAKQRGEDAIIAIQGSLILSQGLHNPAPFQRVMKQLPQQLCWNLV
jgi:TetR/AcrR family transcriptional regulator, lmrAB and yxaGH operons repressor